jgi:hypothetical protein
VRECHRCDAKVFGGRRCNRVTCKYAKMCWQHTIQNKGLRLGKSKIPGSGTGLFATKTFKSGETVANYGGTVMDRKAYERTDSEYGIAMNKSLVLDGKSTQSGMGRYANDCRRSNRDAKHCRDTNARLSIANSRSSLKRTGGVAKLKVKPRTTIKAGDEIYASYGGKAFWNDGKKKEKKKKPAPRKVRPRGGEGKINPPNPRSNDPDEFNADRDRAEAKELAVFNAKKK